MGWVAPVPGRALAPVGALMGALSGALFAPGGAILWSSGALEQELWNAHLRSWLIYARVPCRAREPRNAGSTILDQSQEAHLRSQEVSSGAEWLIYTCSRHLSTGTALAHLRFSFWSVQWLIYSSCLF